MRPIIRFKQPLHSIFLAMTLAACAAQGHVTCGDVTSVHDGDTLRLRSESGSESIRLSGIDAPEMSQSFGHEARQMLATRVLRQTVCVAWDKRDRYGRIVGKVLLDGEDVNLGMLEQGGAWWYYAYRSEQGTVDQVRYAIAETGARLDALGLWAAEEPLAPWEWRTRSRR